MVDVLVDPMLRHEVDDLPENRLVREDRGDVAEDDSGLRKVGHVADELLQLLGAGHATVLKYSRVFIRPSSRPMRGYHPSIVRARVMSGWRWRRSSTGSSRCSILLDEPESLMMVSASSSIVTSCGFPRLTGISSPLSSTASTPRTRSDT